MWWSKHSEPATASFSSTLIIDSPIEAPSPSDASPRSSITPRRDHAPNRVHQHRDDLHLDTVIEGSISLNCRRLTIGEAAKATGEVIAREVIVYGELAGHLQAADRIEIKKHGSVIGDLTTRRILIEEGAYFKGTVQIERRRTPRVAQNDEVSPD